MSLHSQRDRRSPIERDPMFTSWSRSLPRLWYLDQRQATKIDAETLYGSSLYATFYGRSVDESLSAPSDTATIAASGFWRAPTEAVPIGVETSTRTVEYIRSVTDPLSAPVDSTQAIKGGSGVVQPPVHVMVPGDTMTVADFDPPGTWIGSSAIVGTSPSSGAFVAGPTTWTASGTAAITLTASPGTFSPGTDVWSGSTSAIDVTPSSGSFTAGTATWSASAASVGASATSGSFSTSAFLADTLTASNTGSRIADGSLTTVAGGAVYTSADNGTTISGKLFTGNVTVTGDCTNIIFEDCKFTGDIDGGIFFNFIARGANSGVIVRYCTFAPSAAASAGTTCLDISGVTVHRCYITGFENAIRAYGDDVTITQNLIETPNVNDPSSHIDGIEGYGRPGVGISNLVIQENCIDIGTSNVTSPCYLSPYVSITGVVVQDNLLIGGSYCGYNESGVTAAQILGNRMRDGNFGFWTSPGGTTTTEILYWEGNQEVNSSNVPIGTIYIPGLGIERPAP